MTDRLIDLPGAIRAWRGLLGDANVLTPAQAQARYGADTGGATRAIPAALLISEAAQLPEVMRIAQRHHAPVHPISTGRNWGYGTALPPVDGCTVLDLSGLRRILHFDDELGVVTVEPGVTQGMLADFLRAGDHPYLVPTTGAGPNCSLLGNALERGYGITPIADHFAAVTDLEAVLADGSVYRSALRDLAGEDLARLHRWGIGPYTAGLFSQSGLGIVTRMSITLARRPPCVMTGLFSLPDDARLEEAVRRTRDCLATLPGVVGGINLMNRHRVLAMVVPYPRSQLGPDGLLPAQVVAALGRRHQIAPWTGFVTLYGTGATVRAAARELRRGFQGVAARMMFFTPARVQTLRRLVSWLPARWSRHLGRTADTLASSLELVGGWPNETALPLAYWRGGTASDAGALDPARDGCGLLWFAPLVPMRGATVRSHVTAVERITAEHGVEPLITLTSLGERLFDSTVPVLFDRRCPTATARARACVQALTDSALVLGCAPYRTGVDSHAAIQVRLQASVLFAHRLRGAIDPLHLISPGRYSPPAPPGRDAAVGGPAT